MIKNKTKDVVICDGETVCQSIFSKAKGLMFCIKPRSMVFEFNKAKKVPLHMLFVFFPIDVLYLNRNKKVVEIKRSLKPFAFYTPTEKARYVIEIPSGKANRTRVGDRLSF